MGNGLKRFRGLRSDDAPRDSPMSASISAEAETKAWLAQVGFTDDSLVSEAIAACGPHHKQCVRYLMDKERSPQNSATRPRSQSEPRPLISGAAAVGNIGTVGSHLVQRCAQSAPTSPLELGPFDLEALALCSVCEHCPSAFSFEKERIESLLFQICLENPKRYMAAPCNHLVWCSDCAELEATDCPICRAPLSGVVELAFDSVQISEHPTRHTEEDMLRDHALCHSCGTQPKQVMFCGCNHCTLCSDCASGAIGCPVCVRSGTVDSSIKAFKKNVFW